MTLQPATPLFLEPAAQHSTTIGATLDDLASLDRHAVTTDAQGSVWILEGDDLWTCVSDRLEEPTEQPLSCFSDQLLDFHGPITIRYAGIPSSGGVAA